MHLLELTLPESIAVEAACRENAVSEQLLDKAGNAFLQALADGDGRILLYDDECRTLRNVIDIRLRDGKDPIGIPLKAKIYRILQTFALEWTFRAPVNELGDLLIVSTVGTDSAADSAVVAADSAVVAAESPAVKEVTDARSDQPANQSANQSPDTSGGAESGPSPEPGYHLSQPEADGAAESGDRSSMTEDGLGAPNDLRDLDKFVE